MQADPDLKFAAALQPPEPAGMAGVCHPTSFALFHFWPLDHGNYFFLFPLFQTMFLHSYLWAEEMTEGRDIEIKCNLTNVAGLFRVPRQHPMVGYCLFLSLGSRAVPGSPESWHKVVPEDMLCEGTCSPCLKTPPG